MKKVDATTHIEVVTNCPYCNAFEDVFDDVKESMGYEPRADNCDVEATCSECQEVFIVTNVEY